MLEIFKVNRKELLSDLSAGFTTGLFSLPEGMAYAKLIGVKPGTCSWWRGWSTMFWNSWNAPK